MKYLIDTHVLLWLLFRPNKLLATQLSILVDPENTIYVSSISFWEISLKYGLGKLDLSGVLPKDLPEYAKKMDIKVLDIQVEEFATYYQLPSIKKHKDPFDLMLIWQAINNNLVLVSVDSKFRAYLDHGLKLLQC